MSMNKVYFLMAIHFHQPIGNFNFVFEKVFHNSYQPFIETIKEFPQIKLTLHFTGCLLEWLAASQPQYLDQIRALVKRGQIEIMTGGFYEPILPVIPYNDRLGQIAMLSDYVKRNFHYEPCGAWIAERVWEPNLPSALNKAGVKYVILDDSHLKSAGLSHDDMHGYYITEDNAKATAIFASDKKLRYMIPFSQPDKVIDYLKSISNICDGLAAVYGDDAEKFGEWPDTYEWVYEKRWLYNFLLALKQNSGWLKTAHISEYLGQNDPSGRVYIPTASYHEMGEWSLEAGPAEDFEAIWDEVKSDAREEEFMPFLRGGFWRNFLTKYPESNQMHKKMMMVSEKIKDLGNRASGKLGNPDTQTPRGPETQKKLQEAKRELYKGQCNCAYWHGVFGGLYLYHLRSAVFSHLIKAESIADTIIKGPKAWVDCQVGDFDSDGYDEAVLSNPAVSIFFDADEGGSITELDFKPKSVNVVNPLTRRKEAYHSKLLEGAGKNKSNSNVKSIHERALENADMANKVFYDWYKRASLLDHFFGPSVTIDNFYRCQYEELGDFVNQPFKIKPLKNGVSLSRLGQVKAQPVSVIKTIELKKDSSCVGVIYKIQNASGERMDFWFANEFNFSLTNDEAFEQLPAEKNLLLKDRIVGLDIRLEFSRPGDIWRFPVRTISQSESGIEENYQSSAILPNWKFQLKPHQDWDIEISLAIL